MARRTSNSSERLSKPRSSRQRSRSNQRFGQSISRDRSCWHRQHTSSSRQHGRSISSSKRCRHCQGVSSSRRRGRSISSSKTRQHRQCSRSQPSSKASLQDSRFQQGGFSCAKRVGRKVAPAELQDVIGQTLDSKTRSWKFERQPRYSKSRQQMFGLSHHAGNQVATCMKSFSAEEPQGSRPLEIAGRNENSGNTSELAHAQKQISGCLQTSVQTAPALGRTLVGLLFSTPLWQSNLLSSCGREGEAIVAERLLTDLKHDVTAGLHECSHTHEAALPADSTSASELACFQPHGVSNNSFYQWQLSTQVIAVASDAQVVACAGFLTRSSAFMHLATVIRESAILFLCDCYGLSMEQATQCMRNRMLFAFATVHGSNSSHAYHTHHHSIVSGVFYVNVPDGSGAMVAGMGLTIGDNKAILPSDSEISENIKPAEFSVEPMAGKLLIFPSWMPHRVEQSRNVDSPRISISFNLSGEWSELSSLNSWSRLSPSAA